MSGELRECPSCGKAGERYGPLLFRCSDPECNEFRGQWIDDWQAPRHYDATIGALRSSLAETERAKERAEEMVAALERERDMHQASHEEGAEILGEYACAVSGLADELLEPCDPSACAWHLGKRGRALFSKGLRRYQELLALTTPAAQDASTEEA